MVEESSYHDLRRLADLRLRISELETQGLRTSTYDDRDNTDETLASFKRVAGGIEAAWPDDRLQTEAERAGEIGSDSERAAIADELAHRGLA